MPTEPPAVPDINSWLEEELHQQYRHDRQLVDDSWKPVFQTNGESHAPEPPPVPAPTLPVPAPQPLAVGPAEQLVPLRGAAARIAANMAASLAVPTATSQRSVTVKVVEENRRIINQFRGVTGKSKISYTHLLGWAIVQALKKQPGMNDCFAEDNGESFRIVRKQINLGIAVDVATSGGASRSLVVPAIRNAGELTFGQYMAAFDDLVQRARKGKLTVADFQGITISLTNPGTVGTLGSVPRLMPGQGCIIASGAIDYPAEYQGVNPEVLAALGISKIMMLTCTYDHRVIQGAESGMFLGKIQELLGGAEAFYDDIFEELRIPYQPARWQVDTRPALPGLSAAPAKTEVAKEAAVLQLINAYRVRGHLIADLNPLGIEPRYHPELDPATYGFTIWDLDRQFITGNLGALTGEAAPKPVATLREILDTLQSTYCGKIGCEYMSIQHPAEKTWLQQRMEPHRNNWPVSPEEKVQILDRLITAEQFETFLHSRFVGQKRFSLEGAETAISIMDDVLNSAAESGAHEVVIGMAHRGRLNFLANTVGKPLAQIFGEFEGHPDPDSAQGSGDVKYHLGATGVHRSESGREVLVSVAPNPSHLEAVYPVVEGIVRAKQELLGDIKRERVVPFVIHGDAAFAGQGVVAETLNLSQLEGYRTGGTIHLIINNQIGFTTDPHESRSSVYCTDVARTVQAPIFHVNGDDPEACARVAQIAFDYRQQFKKDVVIDMICYRRHGHNEGDDPSFTQPLMYRKIKDHPLVGTIYAERLVRENIVSTAQVDKLRKRIAALLDEGFEEAKLNAVKYQFEDLGVAPGDSIASFRAASAASAASREDLERAVEGLTLLPSDFHMHPKLKGFMDKRKQVLQGAPVDWAAAEALAFGTLLMEGTPVRLSGQDSGRGTFSQRHLVFTDYESGAQYIPLQNLAAGQAGFEVWDSSLSEYAVLGFEFGYSISDPRALVLWEAQFGDFANGAQIMIDQFITVSEQKWGQPNGVVMLLPHGFEGQGPEHSSARIERFLTMCGEDNMQVVNCTTPAQYFHVLRRQMRGGPDQRGMRKPLVIFTPKSLLRHQKVVCSLDDLTRGSFREVIGETSAANAERVTRVLLCSGKIYYDLLAARERLDAGHVAIVRLEQIYPFPEQEIRDILMRYSARADVAWVQEEPRNMGVWRFMRSFVQPMLEASRRKIRYIGRTESASPATGSYKRHDQEQAEIVEAAFAAEQTAPVKKQRVVRRKK
ncbi:MAG: multifunctional oxoglutarate decarboxylase/oxoglutarate dehydrogenase thiamine pyrophosphate-binding subunit/dihydrolipoyllysine-residue succinyltransferase subunit [Acidobacteria bacterium]|nr:multifunctional oxoglutarate decarboxylase/oxoglutarate dehydrogenase thiamine pyrophosphate-binding subunit/dihydrolipoyllysine-residue succinyltransferase subunit [Acidobacteriota bacterium]